ncbi:MAG: hypothetical protein H6710_07015 [Myxococcales bacterium]|nr:hypothetical protein [Myxococcales bacterium]MCB9704687.1 hypothetical protein [Myxococcales bacterium]
MAILPGVTPATAERLSEAVAGLSGLVGFLLVPMMGAWLRLLLRFLESEGLGLGRRRRLGGLTLLRALALSILVIFLAFNWQRAAGELRELRFEAPVVGPTLAGLAVGAAFWAVYALGLRLLRADWQRARTGRRLGGLLR